jgi:predicted RNA binding protein YcfA (HicA-like mRNA interferase family)
MARREKLLERLRSRPKDFSFQELAVVLGRFGFRRMESTGSRVRFEHDRLPSIHLHRPHPRPILRAYQVDQILRLLEDEGLI